MCFNYKKAKEVAITFYEQVISEQQRLQKKINILEDQIKRYPEGNLKSFRNQKRFKWYNNSEYLPKSERPLAQKLAVKKYLLQQKEDLQHQLDSIEHYLSYYSKKPLCADQLLSSTSNYFELLSPYFTPKSQQFAEWAQAPYQHNTKNPEHLIHQTISGEFVRSKSEVMIATILYQNRIPYRYECILQLGDHIRFPDFTIRHPKTGEIFYWEHLGMLDKASYRQDVWNKLDVYISHGIIPTKNLILTYETDSYPLNITQVEKIVNEYFLQ